MYIYEIKYINIATHLWIYICRERDIGFYLKKKKSNRKTSVVKMCDFIMESATHKLPQGTF